MPFLSQKQKLCHQNSHSSSDCLFACGQGNEEKFGVFWQNHTVCVVLERNGPSLRTLAEPEAEVKGVKLCGFFLKKKKFYPNNSHFCRSVCFSVS